MKESKSQKERKYKRKKKVIARSAILS